MMISGRIARAASLCALALVTAGCAVGPRFAKPAAPISEKWIEPEDQRLSVHAAPDSVWWRTFNDATLDSLVSLAYAQNLSLRVAGVRILEARAQLGLAVGNQYPQIQAAFGSATAVGVSKGAVSAPGLDRYFWDYQVGFDAAWELDFWGKFRQDVQAATGQYLATEADYDDALVSLTAEVARTYTVIRTFETLIAQAQENVALQQEGLRIANSRYKYGATSQLDVTQATTLLESTRATIPELQIGLAQSENALAALVGRPPGSLNALLAAPAEIPNAPTQVAVGVPAEMLRRRPDVRSAEFSAMAQCARIGVAEADLYPRFALFGTIGTEATSGVSQSLAGTSTVNLFGPNSLFYLFGPRVRWPILDYGRTRNQVRIQDARFEQSLIGYESTVLKAAQEAEDGLTGYLRSQESATFAQNAADAARKSADLAAIQYREGAVDYQRVLDAQRSLLQEQNTLVRTRSSIVTNLIALYKALGGGWELRNGHPVVPDSTRIEMEQRTNWGNYFSTTTKNDHVTSNGR